MKPLPVAVALFFLLLAPRVAQAEDFHDVANTSYLAANGERTLRLSIVVKAPAERVWWAFSTAEGWKYWTVKTAYVDFREGGAIETNYKANQPQGDRENIRNLIIAIDKGRLLVFRNIQAPQKFQYAEEFGRIVTSIRLEPGAAPDGGAETVVTISGAGYGPGPAFDELYRRFTWGNSYSLVELKKSLETGTGENAKPVPNPHLE